MFHCRWFVWLISFLLFSLAGYTQKDLHVLLYKCKQQGVSNVSSIVKDNKNFTWISTQGGIFRYDSKKFLQVEVREINGSWTAVKRLFYDSLNNVLFAISPDKGLAVLYSLADSLYFQPLPVPLFGNHPEINGIDLFHNGYLVSTNNGIFNLKVQLQSGVYIQEALPIVKNIKPLLFLKLKEDAFAVLDAEKRFIKYQLDTGGNAVIVSNISMVTMLGNATEIFMLNKDTHFYYFATDKGLFRLPIDFSSADQPQRWLSGRPIYSTGVRGKDLFLAASEGFYKLTEQQELIKVVPNTTAVNDDWLSLVYSMYVEADGNIWLGTQNGLAICNGNESPFYQITNTFTGNRSLSHVYHINDYNKKIYLSAANGFYAFGADKKLEEVSANNTFFLSFPAPGNRQMVSGLTSSFIVKDKRLVPYQSVYKAFADLPNLSFNDYAYSGDSLLFLSTENEKGAFAWNLKNDMVTSLPVAAKSTEIIQQTNGLYLTGDQLYVLTDSAFYRYDIKSRRLQKYWLQNPETNKKYGLLFDMIKLKDRYYFASYDNGIVTTDSAFSITKVFNTANGLSDNGVYRILASGDSSLFISSNNGINILNVRTGKIRHLSAEDGLHSNAFEEFSSFKKDSILYFGGDGGVTAIDPGRLDRMSKKNDLLFLDCHETNDKNVSAHYNLVGKDKITIANNITQIIINFQNIVYPYNSRNSYAYKILEFHDSWINLQSQNFLTLTGLAPGTYHLWVQASGENNLSAQTKMLTILLLPKWYQSWWFTLLLWLAAALIAYFIYLIRITQIKKEQEIRIKLASDLHDDLGGTMNSIKIYTNLALMGRERDSYLYKLKESTQEAITGLRDMIWILDDSKGTVEDLLARIRLFASPLCEVNNIKYLPDISEEARYYLLRQQEKRNLYMIIKEAVNNAVKYGDAGEIAIIILLKKNRLFISIRDNGVGFNTLQTNEGNGLKNMKRRAKEAKYNFHIESRAGTGTLITMIAV